jgi:hypothetical protein
MAHLRQAIHPFEATFHITSYIVDADRRKLDPLRHQRPYIRHQPLNHHLNIESVEILEAKLRYARSMKPVELDSGRAQKIERQRLR